MNIGEGVLLLLTNQFPALGGDTPFVESEIHALAEEFSEVMVLSYGIPAGDTVGLPHNVEYLGPLIPKSAPGLAVLLGHPRVLSRALRLAVGDLKAHRVSGCANLVRMAKHAVAASVGALTIERVLRGRGTPLAQAHLYGFWGMNGGLPLALLGPKAKRATVRLHGYDLYEERSGYIPFRPALLRGVDSALVVSDQGAQYLRERYPNESQKIRVSRLGTKDHGLGVGGAEGRVSVLSCSGAVEVKRLDRILCAVRELSKATDVHWTHLGGGPTLQDVASEIQRECPANLHIDLRGSVPHSAVVGFYKNEPVDVFVNLSEAEGVPVSVMEASSFGVPIVATRVGGTAEVVVGHPEAGILVDPQATASDVAEAIRAVTTDRSRFRPRQKWELTSTSSRLARNAAEAVAGRFSEETPP